MNTKLLTQIRAELGLPVAQIERLIERAPYTYKVYTIPKRSGGDRTIAQPARETKLIQKWLVEHIFCTLPIHEAAAAYRPGASIKKNAERHANSKYMVKLDFKEFFPSIKYQDLVNHFCVHLSDAYEDDDIKRMALISCLHIGGRDFSLSIGSPASPCLSNSIVYELDKKIKSWCKDNKVTYTRYADDLTFSTNRPDISSEVEKMVSLTLKEIEYPQLKLNKKKTIHLSKRHKRVVTGVIINSENNLSLGRDRKREISSLIHKYSIGLLGKGDTYRTQGLLGFARDIEPDFVGRLNAKYGNKLLEEIFTLRKAEEDDDL